MGFQCWHLRTATCCDGDIGTACVEYRVCNPFYTELIGDQGLEEVVFLSFQGRKNVFRCVIAVYLFMCSVVL